MIQYCALYDGAPPDTDTPHAPKYEVHHCAKCGAVLIPGDMSCSKCGLKFDQPVPKTRVHDAPHVGPAPSVPSRSPRKSLRGLAVLTLTLFALGWGALFLSSKNQEWKRHSQDYAAAHEQYLQKETAIQQPQLQREADQRALNAFYQSQAAQDAAPQHTPPVQATIHPYYGQIGHSAHDDDDDPISPSIVYVGNMDKFDWTNVQIVINPGSGDYTVTTAVIHPNGGTTNWWDGKPGASIDFNTRDFADRAGNRFRSSLKINRVLLTCDTPSGKVSMMTTM